MSSFFIRGDRDDGDGKLLRRLDGAMLLDYDAKNEIGAVLPHRLYIKETGREVHEEFGSTIVISSVNDEGGRGLLRQLVGRF